MIRCIKFMVLAVALSACVTTADSAGGNTSGSGKAKGLRHIVGTWEVGRAGSIFTCKLVVEEGHGRDSGSARSSGCITFENLMFVNR